MKTTKCWQFELKAKGKELVLNAHPCGVRNGVEAPITPQEVSDLCGYLMAEAEKYSKKEKN